MEERDVKNFKAWYEEERIPICEKERLEGKGWRTGFTSFGEAVNGISGAIMGEIYLRTALCMQTDLVCSNILFSFKALLHELLLPAGTSIVA